MAFSDEEKAHILHHLGYPHFAHIGLARGFGHPSAGPASDLAYDAFYRLSREGEALVRRDLEELACIELELAKLRSKATITRTSEISFDVPAARRLLLAEQRRMISQLAHDLGAPINPLSRMGGAARVTNVP